MQTKAPTVRCHSLAWLILSCLGTCCPNIGFGDLIYGVSGTDSQLVTFDSITGERTNVGTGLGIDNVSVLAFDRSGRLFGLADNGKQLISINRRTGAASLVGAFDLPQPQARVTGLAVDPSTGVMYATRQQTPPNVTSLGSLPQDLVSVDPTNANTTVIGQLGLGWTGGDIAYDSYGELISANRPHPDVYSSLWRVSTSTGRASDYFTGPNSLLAGIFHFGIQHDRIPPITFDSNGDLITLDSSSFLVRIDDSVQRLGTVTHRDITGLAAIAVPEPQVIFPMGVLIFAIFFYGQRVKASKAPGAPEQLRTVA